MSAWQAFSWSIGMAAGHFLYQAFGGPANYAVAAERSFFTVFTVWFVYALLKATK